MWVPRGREKFFRDAIFERELLKKFSFEITMSVLEKAYLNHF